MEHEPIANRSENQAIVLTNTNSASHPGKTTVKFYFRKRVFSKRLCAMSKKVLMT